MNVTEPKNRTVSDEKLAVLKSFKKEFPETNLNYGRLFVNNFPVDYVFSKEGREFLQYDRKSFHDFLMFVFDSQRYVYSSPTEDYFKSSGLDTLRKIYEFEIKALKDIASDKSNPSKAHSNYLSTIFKGIYEDKLPLIEDIFENQIENVFSDKEYLFNQLIMNSARVLEFLERLKDNPNLPLVMFNKNLNAEKKKEIIKRSYIKKNIHLYEDILQSRMSSMDDIIPFVEATVIENNRVPADRKSKGIQNILHRFAFKHRASGLESFIRRYEEYITPELLAEEYSFSNTIEEEVKKAAKIIMSGKNPSERIKYFRAQRSLYYSNEKMFALLSECSNDSEKSDVIRYFIENTPLADFYKDCCESESDIFFSIVNDEQYEVEVSSKIIQFQLSPGGNSSNEDFFKLLVANLSERNLKNLTLAPRSIKENLFFYQPSRNNYSYRSDWESVLRNLYFCHLFMRFFNSPDRTEKEKQVLFDMFYAPLKTEHGAKSISSILDIVQSETFATAAKNGVNGFSSWNGINFKSSEDSEYFHRNFGGNIRGEDLIDGFIKPQLEFLRNNFPNETEIIDSIAALKEEGALLMIL